MSFGRRRRKSQAMIPAEVDLLEPKVLLTATASTPQTNSPCPAAASGQTCHALVLEGDDSDELIAAAFNTYVVNGVQKNTYCLLYTSPSPRDQRGSRMPSSA